MITKAACGVLDPAKPALGRLATGNGEKFGLEFYGDPNLSSHRDECCACRTTAFATSL